MPENKERNDNGHLTTKETGMKETMGLIKFINATRNVDYEEVDEGGGA